MSNAERRFFVARKDLNADGSVSKMTPIDPSTGAVISITGASTWMTLDDAQTMADTWRLTDASPSREYEVCAAPAAPVVDPYTQWVDRTDQGNANLLIRLSGGNLRYVHETRQWLRWTGKRWQLDEHETFVTTQALEVAKSYLEQSRSMRRGTYKFNPEDGTVEDTDDVFKWGTKCRSKSSIEAMIALARKVPGVPISLNDLDRNPWLLGVDNGVVDLRTGQLREVEAREDFVTKRCPVRYNPRAHAPRWESAIMEITGAPIEPERDAQGDVIPESVGCYTPRPALAYYLQKALGYSLTGTTREQKFFICIGDGSNGKGVIFDTLLELLGPYAMAMPSEMFMATKNAHDPERPTALAASVAGVRLVVSSESKDGQQLDIGVVKNHTGDKKLTARKMRQDPVTFEIAHKPFLLTNVQPKIEHLDAAIRGRLHIIPFDRRWNRPGEAGRDPSLPDGDKTLVASLRDEAEGILAWLVEGAMLYEHEGLTPPREVATRTDEYLLEQDHLGRWLTTLERCPPGSGLRASDLYQQFGQWCAVEGTRPDVSTQKAFSQALKRRGVPAKETAGGVRYGLRASGVEQANAVFPITTSLPPGIVPAPPLTPAR